jgi:hypothetical protein
MRFPKKLPRSGYDRITALRRKHLPSFRQGHSIQNGGGRNGAVRVLLAARMEQSEIVVVPDFRDFQMKTALYTTHAIDVGSPDFQFNDKLT